MADTLFLSLVFLAAAAVAVGTEYRHAWNFADMTQDCKPWVSLRVKLWNSTELQNITVTLSTSAIINRRVLIRTSQNKFTARHRAPCLYHGTNANTGDSVFASEIGGRLKMTFKLNGSWYKVEKPSGSSIDAPTIAEKLEAREDEAANLCRYKVPPRNSSEMNARGASASQSRGAFILEKGALNVESFQGATVDKILELVIVVDRSFVSRAGSESNAVTRVMQIINFVNGLYQPLRLRVVLTEIVVWPTDAILVNSDSDGTLNRFTRYKAMQLNIRHDTVMLLSAQNWDGGDTLGVAWLRATCKKLISCGMVTDKYPEEISTALVLTHEIGHNLGFNHMQDHFGCVCNRSSTGCIMNSFLATATRTEAIGWSSCSLNSWSSQASETWRSCLSDAPDVSYTISNSASVCGNGILEAGEQCDCGPEQTCSSKCCDASTCRLKAGARCASGVCCDWNTCRLKARGNVCRTADGPCDVPETCSGSNEWCPSDDKVADGVDCAAGQAYCYKGQCRSSDTQCRRLFSSTARSADSQCFTRLNVKSEYLYGHCQVRLSNLVVSDFTTPTYSYLPCSLENAECGLLHCYQDARPSGSRVTFGSTTCYSLPNIDLSSSGLRSPSFVPDGARCGTNSMCVNSTCTPLSTVRACKFCPDCSGNGVLTTSKVCFCKAGFDPPYCSAAGCGGSVTSPLACSPPVDATTTSTTRMSARSTPANSINSESASTPILRRFTERADGVNAASRLPTTRWIFSATTWTLICILCCY